MYIMTYIITGDKTQIQINYYLRNCTKKKKWKRS